MLCKQRQQQQAKFTDRITGDAKWADVLNFSLQSTSSDVFKIYNGAVTVHQITLREITAISTENVHIPTLRCRFACEEESRAARRAIVTPPPAPPPSNVSPSVTAAQPGDNWSERTWLGWLYETAAHLRVASDSRWNRSHSPIHHRLGDASKMSRPPPRGLKLAKDGKRWKIAR